MFIPNEKVMHPDDLKNYEKALQFSKLEVPSQIHMRNVRIYEKDHIHEIYTKNNPELPHLVLLHGFGGTSLTYIRVFHMLFNHYQIHALDTFGVGHSSDGNFNSNWSDKEVISYYIDALERWRIAMGLK